MVDACEDVEQRPLGGCREADAARGERRHAERGGECDERFVCRLFIAAEMTLQLDEHVRAAEHADKAIHQPADAVPARVERRASRERDQAARMAIELVEGERAFAFRRAHFHARDQVAEIAIAFGRFAQHWQQPGWTIGLPAFMTGVGPHPHA